MFSDVYDATWHKIVLVSQGPGLPDGFNLATRSFNPRIVEVLWTHGLGTGGALDQAVLARSRMAKQALFDGVVYAVVPIYVTSICSEHCLYCNYRAQNRGIDIERVRLSDEDLLREAEFLVCQKGLRALELVYATDPRMRVDSICRHVELLRRFLERQGGGVVGLNAEALDETEYRALRDAGLEFAVLWQETYDRTCYRALHPGTTKKPNFEYRLEAYERMFAAGLRKIGMGVLSGLADWRRDWAMLIEHEAYLHRSYGVSASILGVPRLKPAAGAILQDSPFTPTRQEFLVALAIHNLFSPRTLAFVNTREDWNLCVDMASGGGCLFTFNCSTIPGGYSLGRLGYQFPTGTYDAPAFAAQLRKLGLKPVFEWVLNDLPLDRSPEELAQAYA